ncbi:MAG: helix-turn-helix domain-containing protein [Lachnospiraceae bacterium]
MGRPKKELSDWNKVVEDWEQGQITQSEAAQALGISKKTFYNRVKKGKKASN